jgi:hypothetical protein
VPLVGGEDPSRLRNGRPSSNESDAPWRWFELRCLTDAANAQA